MKIWTSFEKTNLRLCLSVEQLIFFADKIKKRNFEKLLKSEEKEKEKKTIVKGLSRREQKKNI